MQQEGREGPQCAAPESFGIALEQDVSQTPALDLAGALGSETGFEILPVVPVMNSGRTTIAPICGLLAGLALSLGAGLLGLVQVMKKEVCNKNNTYIFSSTLGSVGVSTIYPQGFYIPCYPDI